MNESQWDAGGQRSHLLGMERQEVEGAQTPAWRRTPVCSVCLSLPTHLGLRVTAAYSALHLNADSSM